MDKAIRVLVANRPRLMRELVLTTFADQPDIEIVGEVSSDAEIAERVHQTHPDFLVIALDTPARRPPICDTVLRQHPEMRIIALAPDQGLSSFYWASFNIHASSFEASEESILDTVRRGLAQQEGRKQ